MNRGRLFLQPLTNKTVWREAASRRCERRFSVVRLSNKNILTFQQELKFRTTADWDYRTSQEVRGDVPPTMKEWSGRVRGY